jgi:hypothetical protein
MIPAPYLADYRRWEDQGLEQELIGTVADETWIDMLNREALTTTGKSEIRDEIQEAVWQTLAWDTENLRKLAKAALYYSEEHHSMKPLRTQAEGFVKELLAELKESLEGVVNSYAEQEYKRRCEQAQEDRELRHV